jgi:UDP-N-acetylmuramoylalanine--D-glutamate ligase
MGKYNRVLIMGLGLHGGGVGVANFFLSRGSTVVITDLKTEDELKPSIAKLESSRKLRLVLGRHDFEDFKNTDLIIKNPGVPPGSPYIKYALENGVAVDTDIGIFIDNIEHKTDNIFGVTGTKGKSTTASLLHSIIVKKCPGALLGGNITVSVFDIIDKVHKGSCVILELSSFQLGGLMNRAFSPRVAIFTNFMEDHLDYYSDMKEYFHDKTALFRFQKKGDVLIVNRDDPVYNAVRAQPDVTFESFGFGNTFPGRGSFLQDGKIYYRGDTRTFSIMRTENIKLPGRHNLYNVLAASTAACAEGIAPKEIENAVSGFNGLAHRLEYVGRTEKAVFYNDSAATTPGAAVSALRSFNGRITLIAGGSDKGLELKQFIDAINDKVEHLLLLEGTGTQRLVKGDLKKDYIIFESLEKAVGHIAGLPHLSGTVLLSPGFASFGMFVNEFQRGNMFKELIVKRIKEINKNG